MLGESAERVAQRNGISRRDQDEFAARRAARAIESGRFAGEVVAVEASCTEAARGSRFGICAAGGLGAAALLEAV